MRANWEPLDFGPRSKYCIIVSREHERGLQHDQSLWSPFSAPFR